MSLEHKKWILIGRVKPANSNEYNKADIHFIHAVFYGQIQ